MAGDEGMTLDNISLEAVCFDIRRREEEAYRLSLVVFSEGEYKTLQERAREVVKRSIDSDAARTVVLAFAFAMLRRDKRYHYVTEASFWRDFERELNLIGGENRTFLYDRIFSRGFRQHEITLLWSEGDRRREFVLTIREEIRKAPGLASAQRQQIVEFFIWFFNHAPEKVTQTLVKRYQVHTGRQLSIAPDALPTLDHDFRVLAEVIQFAESHDLSVSVLGWTRFCEEVVRRKGRAYDLRAIRLLSGGDGLQKLILLLQNHLTPTQFLREIASRPANTRLITPAGQVVRIDDLLRQQRPDTLEFGTFRVGNLDYRVVPARWLRLEGISAWPLQTLVELRDGWIGYRHTRVFTVQSGGRVQESRRCHLPNGVFYIWAGPIAKGQRMVVDGNPCTAAQGAVWDATVRVTQNDDSPRLSLVLVKLLAYFPQSPSAEIHVSTSQGAICHQALDSNGSRSLYNYVALPLLDFREPVTLSVQIGGDDCGEKCFEPQPAMLFSTQSRELLTPGKTLAHEGRVFWLFCASGIKPVCDAKVLLCEEKSLFGHYHVFRVVWQTSQEPFLLKAGEAEWRIERQQHFDLWLTPHQNVMPSPGNHAFALAPYQRWQITRDIWRVATNADLSGLNVRCQWWHEEEMLLDEPAVSCLHRLPEGHFALQEQFVGLMQNATKRRWGRFKLCFVEVVDEVPRVWQESSVAVLPQLRVEFPSIVSSDALFELRVLCDVALLQDIVSGENTSQQTRRLWPSLRWLVNQDAASLGLPSPQPSSVRAAMPICGETLELKACPWVFDMKLFSRTLGEAGRAYGDFAETDALDWNALSASALAVATKPGVIVRLLQGGLEIACQHADARGFCIWRHLADLRSHCLAVCTQFRCFSEGIERTFSVLWTPQVSEIAVEREASHCRVRLQHHGPAGAEIFLRYYDMNGIIISQQVLVCTGKVTTTLQNISERVLATCANIVVVVSSASGNAIPVRQVSLAPGKATAFPAAWLSSGVGVSSPKVLTLLEKDPVKR
jgi:hypothetical protein